MLIAGLDYSSHALDIVTINIEGNPEPHWTHVPMKRDGHRLPAFSAARHARQALDACALLGAFWDDIVAAYIEHAFGPNPAPLLILQGAIMAQIPPHVICDELRPSEWRGLLALRLGVPKAQLKANARAYAITHGAPDNWSGDAYDAMCIALAGRTLSHRAAQGDAA